MGLIKKYETGELIGTGSMGSVYRARDIVLEREVALKILHSRGDLDPELKERFYREARLGANLRHPNVVIVYELDEYNGVPFMAMELLNGIDGRRFIAERRVLSLAQKVELFAQVCDGLAEAHRRGIVHRDIKPSNLFIQDDGTAKVLDFGIARVSSSKLTVAGTVLGTPNYMAPEQINRRQCDSRSDLFSTAIVFFEILVHSHPFQSTFIPRRIVEDDPDTLFERDALIPLSLADLLYKALQKRPESRVQTAEEFAAGLRAVLQELRTGLATEPIIQTASPVTLPDPTPTSAGNPNSPDGRLAGFVQMMSDFDTAVQMKDVESARSIVAEMIRMEAVDQRFSEALLDCRKKLEQLQSTVQPTARAAAAGAGAAYSTSIAEGASARTGSNGSTTGTRNEPSSLEHRSPKGDEDVPTQLDTDPFETMSQVCGTCGAKNRDAAIFCQSCGMPIEQILKGQPSQSDEPAVGQSPGGFADTAARLKGGLSQNVQRGLEAVSTGGRRLWTQISALPRRTQYAIGGIAAVFVLTAIALFFVLGGPISVEKALGAATVQTAETALLESESPSGRRLKVLPRATKVNILSRITSPDQRFVRVQSVVANKADRPGFVALADLGQWTSSDPAVAWEYLGLGRSAADASIEASRVYSQSLTNFISQFAGTSQARLAAVDQASLHLRLAERAKAAGKDRAEWQGDLDQAKNAMDAEGGIEASGEEGNRMRAKYQELSKADEAQLETTAETGGPQSAKDLAKSSELRGYLRKAAAAWQAGDVNSCEVFAKKAQELDPNNTEAKAWLWQVQKSREQ